MLLRSSPQTRHYFQERVRSEGGLHAYYFKQFEIYYGVKEKLLELGNSLKFMMHV